MALVIWTSMPKKLKSLIKSAIDDRRIVTWAFDDDERMKHVTSSGQWEEKARVTISTVENTALVFAIHGPDHENLTVTSYAIYLGRLAEMLLTHFDHEFTALQITPLLDNALGDEK